MKKIWDRRASLLAGAMLVAQPVLAQIVPPTGDAATSQTPPDASSPAPASQLAAPVTQASADNNAMDIVVTARKRQESLLNVPVIETVLPAQTLGRQQVVDLKDITKLVPGLLIGTSVLSIGQQVSIRGVGTSSADPGIDQSVSLNLDGLALAQGLAYSSGLFDVGQVEVLKGPQALFYGKSSPGGVISLRTADPTDKFEVIARAGYEFEAQTKRGELIVSGPVTDTLKARLAGFYSASQGFYYNDATALPGTGASSPRYRRDGRSRDYQVRGTVLWNPDPKFGARLKANLVRDRTVLPENFQLTSCPDGVTAPLGVPFIGNGEDCRKDRVTRTVDLDPANFPGFGNGVPFVRILQRFGTLELNYRPLDDLTLTSVTGYYNLHSNSILNTSFSGYAGPTIAVNNPRFRRRDTTEELRLNSDFDFPVNFTIGGFYQDAHVSDRIVIQGNTAYGLPAIPLQDGLNRFNVKTYSGYGQLRWKIAPTLELAGGARYTDETRREDPLLFPSATLPVTAPLAVTPPTPRLHSSNVAPEVTLTWKPTPDLTAFAAYKKGYKSGSFSIATPASLLNPAQCISGAAACSYLDNSFGDERVHGEEVGLKGRLLNRRLTFSLAGYDYLYKGLQVGAIEPTVGSVPVIRTVNAGSGRTYGVELATAYRPAYVEGLGLNAAVNWNHTRFNSLDGVPCYGGQTVAAGCNEQLDPSTGLFFAQDLSGTRFVRAPRWQGNFGFDYELRVGDRKKLIFSNNNIYTARFLTALGDRTDYYQGNFFKTDLSLTLQGPDDRWAFAIIGKNVTNKLTASKCDNINAAGGLGGGQITGGTASGPAGIDEVGCYMDPGREVWLRLTIKPFG